MRKEKSQHCWLISELDMRPPSRLITDALCKLALCAMAAIALPAQTLTTLYTFVCTGVNVCPDGSGASGLLQAINGDLYGTTDSTVFKITPRGVLTTLSSFGGSWGSLVQATNGDLYGTTTTGGVSGVSGGSIFKITPGGALTPLYIFPCPTGPASCSDGGAPLAGLVQATNADLYGTTSQGGTHDAGTVYKITPGGTFTLLYSFCSRLTPQGECADGTELEAGLVQANNGDLYGTSSAGGTSTRGADYGTIFKITPGGALTTVYNFCSKPKCADGHQPATGLIQAIDGELYGTTKRGGANDEGTIFKITLAGKLTTLYSFCAEAGCADGQVPQAALLQASDGNFYGTTRGGGAKGRGTLFKITAAGKLTTLYSFCTEASCADGEYPQSALIQDTSGELYGAAGSTIFTLSLGLGRFVKAQPGSGRVGQTIDILGTNIAGASGVTFNGVAASFSVASTSLLKAIVPEGATSGRVRVVTPDGTLESNAPFQVRP